MSLEKIQIYRPKDKKHWVVSGIGKKNGEPFDAGIRFFDPENPMGGQEEDGPPEIKKLFAAIRGIYEAYDLPLDLLELPEAATQKDLDEFYGQDVLTSEPMPVKESKNTLIIELNKGIRKIMLIAIDPEESHKQEKIHELLIRILSINRKLNDLTRG